MLSLLALLLAAAPGGARLDFDPQTPDVAAVSVERAAGDGRWHQVALLRVAAGRRLVYEDPAAPPGARYRVAALDAVGNVSAPRELPAAAPGCSWRGAGPEVPISCERACDCAAAGARLTAARVELLRYGLVDALGLAAALAGLEVHVVSAPSMRAPGGEDARGIYLPADHQVVLARDMSAALHELLHAYFHFRGHVTAPSEHPEWASDGALREVDLRFQARFRTHPLP
jgi:hypothetical protein